MTQPRYPLLLVSGPLVYFLADAAVLERLVAVSTRRAVAAGFYKAARVFDAGYREFAISVTVAPGGGLLQWFRPRVGGLIDWTAGEQRDLAHVKECVLSQTVPTKGSGADAGREAAIMASSSLEELTRAAGGVV